MSPFSPTREQTFAKLFHATAEKYRHGRQEGSGLIDAEGKAFLSSIGYTEEEFFDFVEDYAGHVGESIRWCRKAADDGDVCAQSDLGSIYANGLGVARDYAQAAFWYRQAADKGIVRAQSGLGYLYANGLGVAQDHAQAAFWYRRAADRGDVSAESGLGYLYANGLGVAQDHAQAAFWYGKAAEKGSDFAQLYLGYQCEHGQGIPKNHALALFWFRKAAEQGNAQARGELKKMGLSAVSNSAPDEGSALSSKS